MWRRLEKSSIKATTPALYWLRMMKVRHP
jgi:hypothetical protein